MAITIAQVKELRERTSCGILDAKKALEATNGDIEKAIKYLQEKGVVKAAKKMGRLAAEGVVLANAEGNQAVIIELNCETDFVALNKKFQDFSREIAQFLLNKNFANIDEARRLKMGDLTLEEKVKTVASTIGENIQLSRAEKIQKTEAQCFGIYTHSNNKIASVVVLGNGTSEVAKNISMHVSAMNPEYLNQNSIPKTQLEIYKEAILKEMASINKPDNIKEMMAQGKLRKQLSEITLEDQTFVMESKVTVNQYAKQNDAKILMYKRYEVGEKIEKN